MTSCAHAIPLGPKDLDSKRYPAARPREGEAPRSAPAPYETAATLVIDGEW